MNIDGYPDLFLTLHLEKPSGQLYRRSYLLTSIDCTLETCNSGAVNHQAYGESYVRRYFKKNVKVSEEFETSQITDMAGESASMLVPMDVDEDGRLDILV